MTENHDISERLERLERREGCVIQALLVLVGLLFVVAFILDIGVQFAVPAVSRMLDQMMPGEPLPALTLMVIKGRAVSLGLDVVFLAGVIALLASRKRAIVIPVGTAAAVILAVKAALTWFALLLPILSMVRKLTGGLGG